jgi:hypothetical protein
MRNPFNRRMHCFVCGEPVGGDTYVRATVMKDGRRTPAVIHARCAHSPNASSPLMKVVARFDPPNAQAAAREWREQHAAALAALPDEAIRIDIGRTVGGDFVQIRIADGYANEFADEKPAR